MSVGSASAATDISIGALTYTVQAFDNAGNATAGTFNVFGHTIDNSDWWSQNVAFWTATTSFNASASDALSIRNLAADDRVAIEINGVDAGFGAGINNYGTLLGAMVFTPGGASQPYTFHENGPYPTPYVLNGLFQNGLNTLTLIVNNTFDGTRDADPGPLVGFNPTSVTFDASLTSVSGGVPEPSTWAMLLFGFGAVGTISHRARRRALASV